MKKLLALVSLTISALCLTCIMGASSKTVEWTVPFYFMEADVKNWDTINYNLVHTDAKVIILDWQGNGGWSGIGDKTIDAMEQAKAQGKIIILKLIGDAISMHANVACHASQIQWGTSHYLVFHSGFLRNSDGSKNYSNDDHYFKYCEANGPVKGLLTEDDIHKIIDDRQRVELNNLGQIILPDYP